MVAAGSNGVTGPGDSAYRRGSHDPTAIRQIPCSGSRPWKTSFAWPEPNMGCAGATSRQPDVSLLRPEETEDDGIDLPLWLRVHYRVNHPELTPAPAGAVGDYPEALETSMSG
jgi:hypothetical protein